MRIPGRTVITSALLTGVLLLPGCGGENGEKGEKESRAPRTATGTVEQLAAKTGCEPNMQIDAEELRQGICETGDGRYVLATFRTDKNQRDWINEAKPYGGTYLVGKRWVAVGEAKVLGTLRGRLGGTVESGEDHSGGSGESGHSGGSGGEHEGHHGG
jgi:hypothetical protein